MVHNTIVRQAGVTWIHQNNLPLVVVEVDSVGAQDPGVCNPLPADEMIRRELSFVARHRGGGQARSPRRRTRSRTRSRIWRRTSTWEGSSSGRGELKLEEAFGREEELELELEKQLEPELKEELELEENVDLEEEFELGESLGLEEVPSSSLGPEAKS